MDSVAFAIGILIGGLISCFFVVQFGLAAALQVFAFLTVGMLVVLMLKAAWSIRMNLRNDDRRLHEMVEATAKDEPQRAAA